MLPALEGDGAPVRDLILKAAADLNADLVGFAPASRFDSDDVLFQF